jgi:hypothetical protein
MISSGESGKPMTPKRGLDSEEVKLFNRIQNILALTLYVAEHGFAINAMSFVGRDDEGAHKIRHDAGMEWVVPHAGSGHSLAELFDAYWRAHREEVEATDLSNEAACLALIEKVRGGRSETPEPQT